MEVVFMPRNRTLNAQHTSVLQNMVFSLLSNNEREIINILREAAHPLSLLELNKKVGVSYRTLRRLVLRLEDKKLVFTFRDVIKVVSLNPILTKGAR
jgi:predicted transcriptional regulator